MPHRTFFSQQLIIFCLLAAFLGPLWSADSQPAQAQNDNSSPAILWLLGDQLWRNDSPIVESNVLTASLAPSTERVAYLTIPDEARPMALVLYDIATQQTLATVTADELPPFEDFDMQFAQPHWLDNDTVIFTSLAALGGPGGVLSLSDVWRFDTNGTLEQLRTRGAGGFITVSPDRSYVALARPGEYQNSDQPAAIEIADAATLALRSETYTFPAVASGTEIPYIPPVKWSIDSSTLAFAAPYADLAYAQFDSPASGDSQLCQMSTTSVDCQAVNLGFPAFPAWSASLDNVAFQRSVGVNEWELVLQRGATTQTLPTTTALPEPLFWVEDALLFRENTLEGVVYAWVTATNEIEEWPLSILGVQALRNGQLALAVGRAGDYTIQVYDRATDTFTDIITLNEGFPRFVSSG